jgi:TPR repeat protein/putative methionine-R-sulfoxide reductase with GAF domain
MVAHDFGPLPMAATNPVLHSNPPNRRRRVRHRIQTPAYASFTAESKSAMLDLHEIVNVSEDGVAIQCSTPLEVNRTVELCLDLAECDDHIYTSAQVVWSDPSGRAGLLFSELPPVSLFRLREWLFLNAMTGAAANESALAASTASLQVPTQPNYTDTLAAVTAVQRQVESLGADLPAALQLIAERARNLIRASGAAIALAADQPDVMDCRASSGDVAPPIGVRLQVGSGFSGECVKSGMLLRCDDSETDSRVDRESCRALGVRSILAAPVRVGDKSVGILEAFAPQPNAFTENDSRVLHRLADTVVAAFNRSAVAENLPQLRPQPEEPRFTPPGGVLFASTPEEEKKAKQEGEEKPSHGISLPRSHLIILLCAAATIALALGYRLAPWIQADVAPWLQSKIHARGNSQMQTVLASSRAPKLPSVETASFDQLRQMADNGDPAAQNALGLRYFQGDPKNQVPQDERQAFRWFTAAAEGGNLAAQSKLGFLYWSGRGVPKDVNKAYFWTVLARARGDEGSKDLAAVLASGMTRAQTSSIEQEAEVWLQQHQLASSKPPAGLALK